MLRLTIILVIVSGLTTNFGVGCGDFNGILSNMEELLKNEVTLLKELRRHIHNKNLEVTSLRSAAFYKEELKNAFENIKQYMSNTITMYLLIRGLSVEWREVEKLLTAQAVDNVDVENGSSDEMSDFFENYYRHYQMLCEGEISLPADIEKQLKCRYVHEGTPFLKLAPFKEEELYLQPRVVMFHDVIHDEEIETIKKEAQPRFMKSQVYRAQGSNESDGRIGETAWLFDDVHKHIEAVNRRVEDMTNLTIDSAEFLQITYYQIGGKYDVHFDFDFNQEAPFGGVGNRIATLMYYLSDVEEGGRTIFFDLNVTITPRKGSAVFWYNLQNNGDLNLLSRHAGCPVISGTKWVANKWLNEIGQEFRRTCTWEKEPQPSKYVYL